MAIEIKELRIKVTIAASDTDTFSSEEKMSTAKLQEMKSDIVKECISKVMEKIKEKAER